ncbi:hypothetical protein ABBQ38_006535 [Trebouxia sp. C0009 RCD-2024]
MSVKAARPGIQVCEAARGLTDTSRKGLLMLGKAGLGTKFHLDRTQAEMWRSLSLTSPRGSQRQQDIGARLSLCLQGGGFCTHIWHQDLLSLSVVTGPYDCI